jgi:hypothetical protein
MSEGHQYASLYPLSKLWIETEIARERINARLVTEATLTFKAIVAVISSGGGGVKDFNEELRKLNDG